MATSSVLYAAAKEIGVTCDGVNRSYLECKVRDEDPAACLREGKDVQACALDVLKQAMASCGVSFKTYAACIDAQSSQEYKFERCRVEESALAACRADAVAPAPSPGSATRSDAGLVGGVASPRERDS